MEHAVLVSGLSFRHLVSMLDDAVRLLFEWVATRAGERWGNLAFAGVVIITLSAIAVAGAWWATQL